MINQQHLPRFSSLDELPKDFFINSKKVLVIHSESAKKNGLLLKIKRQLKEVKSTFFNTGSLKYSYSIFNSKNKIFKDKYDVIVGIGGGNQIDISKIIFVRSAFPDWQNQISSNEISLKKTNTRFVVISTLPGSGAEASKASVLNSQSGKIIFTSRYFIPEYVFYDIESIEKVPDYQLKIRLIDAISHSLESNNSILSNKFSGIYSSYVLKDGLRLVKTYCSDNSKLIDKDDIKTLCLISFYGGLSQSEAGSGLCHALAHTLEKKFNLSHSECIFLCLLVTLKYDRKLGNRRSELYVYKTLKLFYNELFETSNIKKHIEILENLELDSFIALSKLDPCWKLEKKRIDEKKLKSIFRLKIKNKKWNF